MGLAVVTVASGGLPVVESTTGGTPVTEAANGRGVPVTKVVGKPGLPVVFETIGVGGGGLVPGVTGTIGWWDASVTASLNLTGSNINSVADQSGGGRTMTKTGSNFPQYSATGFNSTKPAIVFNNTLPSALQAASFPMGTGNTLTAWYVGTIGSGLNNDRVMNYLPTVTGNDWDSANYWGILKQTGTTISIIRNTVVVGNSSLSAHPAPYRMIFTVNSSGAITFYANGVLSGTGTVAGNWANNGVVQIGRQTSGSGYWNGPIAECGIATGYSDAAAVAALDTYLKNKWGL